MSKSIFSISSLLLAAIITFSYGCKKDEKGMVDKQIETFAKSIQVPMTLKDKSSLVECTYKDKTLTLKRKVTDTQLQQIKVEQKQKRTQDSLLLQDLPKNIIDKIVFTGASIRYVYLNDSDSVSFILSPDDLIKSK